MKYTLTLIAVVISFSSVTYSASAKPLTTKQRYYHASGIVKWIGAHARFTQYSPNYRKKRHWQAAVHFWAGVRDRAWAELHPKPTVSTSGWQQTVNCENSGSWNDSPGYFMYGLQFDPTTWRIAASHTGRWDSSKESQVINAIWTAQHAQSDPWPNCPDPYFG